MRTTFDSTKIYFTASVTFADRLKVVSAFMGSKILRTYIKDNSIPVYTVHNEKKTLIGYVKDFKAKVLARSIGETKIHFYADLHLDTTDQDILYMANKYITDRDSRYRMYFISSNLIKENKADATEMIKGLMIRFNV